MEREKVGWDDRERLENNERRLQHCDWSKGKNNYREEEHLIP